MRRYGVVPLALAVLIAVAAIGVSMHQHQETAMDLMLRSGQESGIGVAEVLVLSSLDALAEDLGLEVRGLVLEAADLTAASGEQLRLLGACVESGVPVFAVGEGVFPGLLAELLGISATQAALPRNYSQLLADGLCLMPKGPNRSITVTAPRGWRAPPERLLQDIGVAIDVIAQSSLLPSSPLTHDTAQWTLVGISAHLFDASGLETYVSSVMCYQANAAADSDELTDYWQLLVRHTALSKSQPFTSARSSLELGRGQVVVEYGASKGRVTGDDERLMLLNLSAPSVPRIEHQLQPESAEHSSGDSFAWGQTVLLSSPQGEQTLSLTFANNLRFTWPRDEFLDEWACQFPK